jgi:polyisoprenoid-binding protein YceI
MTIPADKNPAAPATSTTWEIDPTASRVEFSARMRFMFLANITVPGRFTEVHGTLTGTGADNDLSNAQVSVKIGTASLDTHSAARDKHLRSADFFDVENYPQLTFTSRRIEALDPAHRQYRITGLLAIRDVSREVTLDARYAPQPGAVQRHTVNLTTALDRRDFGLVWSRPMQKIADDVTIRLHIEMVPTPSPA